jgi:hypothetical protein
MAFFTYALIHLCTLIKLLQEKDMEQTDLLIVAVWCKLKLNSVFVDTEDLSLLLMLWNPQFDKEMCCAVLQYFLLLCLFQ